MMATDTHTPRAWVGCLGCYNAGALVGDWVDGTLAGDVTVEDLHAENQGRVSMAEILEADPYAPMHEELWVMNHEDFGGLLEGECSPAKAARIAEAIERIDAEWYPLEAVAAWVDDVGRAYADLDDLSDFEEAFAGEYDSEEDYAEELAEELGLVNDDESWPSSYIDWKGAARELFMSDYWSADAGGGRVYVFRRM